MKIRSLIISIFFLFSLAVSAQDTIGDGNPWYMFWTHGQVTGVSLNAGFVGSPMSGHSMIQYYSKDSMDLVVWGVACTMMYIPVEEDRQDESVDMTQTVMLLNHVAHGNPPTVSLIDSTNVLGVMKQCQFEYRTINGEVYYSPSYEFYFNTPHYFTLPTDTFYISHYWPDNRGSYYIKWYHDNWEEELYNMTYPHWPEHFMYVIYGICELDNNMPIQQGWGAQTEDGMFGFEPNLSQYVPTTSSLGYMYPIIGLRCMPPHPRFVGREGNAATLSWWQAESGEEYELSVGPYGSDPDTGLLMTTVDTFLTVPDLQLDVIYQALVRKACRYTTAGYDTLVWSDWSRPATFRVGVGIDEAEESRLQVSSSNGCVAVQGLAAGERADIYDMKGCQVASLTADGLTPPLPQGVYMVRATGARARKVVVIR